MLYASTRRRYRYYTMIPPDISTYLTARTFVILPKSADAASHFEEARNTLATDEVQAHIGMFEASTNDGYYQLGLSVASVVREAVMKRRGVKESGADNVRQVADHSEEFTVAEENFASPDADATPAATPSQEEDLLA
jgi:hypothetical protein